ncbi:MAG: hypothetical protein ACXW5U_10700 [Thermoanaerobaculia bacterium]
MDMDLSVVHACPPASFKLALLFWQWRWSSGIDPLRIESQLSSLSSSSPTPSPRCCFCGSLTFRIAHLVFVGMGVAAAIAVVAAVWLFLVVRTLVKPVPLSALVAPVVAVAILALGLVIWFEMQRYTHIAMYGGGSASTTRVWR